MGTVRIDDTRGMAGAGRGAGAGGRSIWDVDGAGGGGGGGGVSPYDKTLPSAARQQQAGEEGGRGHGGRRDAHAWGHGAMGDR